MTYRHRNHRIRSSRNLRVGMETLEQRLPLAADALPALVCDAAIPALLDDCALDSAASVPDGPRETGPLQLLPGDTAVVAADGHQIEPQIAQGGNQYLAVWTDYRSSPENHPGFLTEGFGGDVYGSILDANGNPVNTTPFVINQDFADQQSATAGWNGEHWLVAWKSPTLTGGPTYERIMAARVASDGSVLDQTPIEVHNETADGAYYDGFEPIKIASDGQDWVVVFKNTYGTAYGEYAIRVAADGSIPVATPIKIGVDLPSYFDIAFAQDRYLFTWQDTPGFPGRGRLYTPDLQPIGAAFSLPGAEVVASDGTDFIVTWYAQGPGAWYTLKAIKVNHNGTRPNPQGSEIAVMQYRSTFVKGVWDGAHYWSTWDFGVGLNAARLEPDGTVIDPGGFSLGSFGLLGLDAGVGGGIQLVWNDGGGSAISPKDVYATHISAPTQVGGNRLLSSGAPAQLDADFAAGPDMFAVAFESRVSGNTSIKVQRLDTHGAALDAEPLEVASGPEVYGPGVAFDGTRYMITWRDRFSLFSQRMSPEGVLLGAPIEVMTTWDNPDVAGIDGTFLVVGTDYLSNDENSRVMFTRRVDGATGALLDPEPQEIGHYVIFSRNPHVVSFGNRWLVTWQTNISHDNTIASTKGAFVELDGTSPGAFQVGLGWRPNVAVSEDRALFVAVSHTVASAHADIEGQIMLADGTLLPAFTISDAPDKQLRPAATFDGENFRVAWQDKRNSEFYYDERTDIYGTRVSPDGEVLDLDANGYGGIAMTSTNEPERDAALITSGGTTLFATSTFRAERELGAYRIGVSQLVGASIPGDFNGDQLVDASDIDLLGGEIQNGTHVSLFDLTGDGLVDDRDLDELVRTILGTRYGDANLDQLVDGTDFNQWNANKFQPGGWAQGDYNVDGIVDGRDFGLWNANKFQSGSGVGLRQDAVVPMATQPEVLRRSVDRTLTEPRNNSALALFSTHSSASSRLPVVSRQASPVPRFRREASFTPARRLPMADHSPAESAVKWDMDDFFAKATRHNTY